MDIKKILHCLEKLLVILLVSGAIAAIFTFGFLRLVRHGQLLTSGLHPVQETAFFIFLTLFLAFIFIFYYCTSKDRPNKNNQ